MKKSTHIQKQKNKAQQLKLLVCQLIGSTEEQYCEYQMKEGRRYLQSCISNSPDMIDEILATRSYWSWWRNHWMQRDEWFVSMCLEDLPGLTRKHVYNTLNDYRGLLNEIHPNKQVLEMSYADMMDRVIREVKYNENGDN